MSRFRGLVYVKHGRVGSRSEGPDCYLQTYRADFLLRYQERHPWQPDYALEFYGRHMVEIEGTLVDAHTIKVASISDILSPMIPRPGEVAAHLGDPFALRYGQSVHLDDAKLKIEFHAVEQDSRCPVGVVCVWEGQCVVGLSLTRDSGESQKFSLTARAGHPELAAAEVFGYRVELHGVEPVPTKDASHPGHEQYRLSVEISALA